MSRRSRRQSKISPAQVERLIDAAITRRLAAMGPPATPRNPRQDALWSQMVAQQAPAKMGTPMFPPGAPLEPQPGMALPQGPRQFVYPVGYNIYSQPRSTEATSFETLRNLASLYDGIGLCEQVWLDTVAKLQLAIKPRTEIIAEQGKSIATRKYADRIRKYSDFFAVPDVGNGYDLKSWLRAAVRDQLQLDAVAIYLRRTRGGGLYSMELVDGATIKPLIDPRGRRPQPPYPAFQQFVYGVPAGWYASDELLYLRETTRTESIFGLSRVERIIIRVNQALRKENKDLARFTDGNTPPGILTPPDDGSQWTPEQLMAYQEMWDALLAGNDQARSRIKVVQPGSTLTPLQDQDIFVDFDRFLLNVTAACYSMTMADLGFTENVNKSSGESQENVFYRRAVQPLMDRYAIVFTQILRQYFGEQDLIVSWSGFEESEDFNAMAASYVSLTNSGITSPTTAAHLMNLPWSGPEIPNFVLTKDGPIFLADAADPAIRKAQNDAKIAGLQLPPPGASMPAASPDDDETPDNDAAPKKAAKGSERQRSQPRSSGDKGRAASRVNDDGEGQRIERAAQSHTGIMIAFMLDPETAEQLALPGGEAPSDLHITLAYLGNIDDQRDPSELNPATSQEQLSSLLASFASQQKGIAGHVGGLARFSPSPHSDDTSPVVALVNIPGLQDWRGRLVTTLEAAGYNVAKNFDYTPHITLAYVDADAPMPVDEVPALPLHFAELCLAIGDERQYFPLGSTSDELRCETSDAQRGASTKPRAARRPSHAQIVMEQTLAQAIRDFLGKAKVSRDGIELPDETAQEALLNQLTDLLERAVQQGRQIAAGQESRGLVSAAKNLAGRAVQTVSGIIDQLKDKAEEIIADVFGSGEHIDDPEAAIEEVEEELEAWAADYADLIAGTEITAAIEGGVLDELMRRGASLVTWDTDEEPCEECRDNEAAGPWPTGTPFPSGDTAPPAHPRCRCTLSPA